TIALEQSRNGAQRDAGKVDRWVTPAAAAPVDYRVVSEGFGIHHDVGRLGVVVQEARRVGGQCGRRQLVQPGAEPACLDSGEIARLRDDIREGSWIGLLVVEDDARRRR